MSSAFTPARLPAPAIVALALVVASPYGARAQVQPARAAAGAGADAGTIRVSLADACVLRVEDGRLVFATRMPYTGVVVRPVEVDGLPGTTRASYRPYRFLLDNTFTDDRATATTLSIERRRSFFRLQRTVDTAGDGRGELSVTFTQGYVDDEALRIRQGQARLVVQVLGEQVENIEADDFSALRRDHARAFYRYLAPALRTLRADLVVTVDPWVARQVLADPVPADRLPAEVARLVAELGDRSPKVRRRASARLAALGAEALAEVEKLDRAALSPEQSLAIDVLVKRHRPLPRADAERMRGDVHFLADCLYSDEPDVAASAAARLAAVTGAAPAVDLALPPAARADVIEAYRRRVATREVPGGAGRDD